MCTVVVSNLEDLDFCRSVGLSTFLDIRVEDVSNLGGGWKIWTFVSHGSTKKGRKTKEFPRIEGTIFEMW
jgi:hypothetical protein